MNIKQCIDVDLALEDPISFLQEKAALDDHCCKWPVIEEHCKGDKEPDNGIQKIKGEAASHHWEDLQ